MGGGLVVQPPDALSAPTRQGGIQCASASSAHHPDPSAGGVVAPLVHQAGLRRREAAGESHPADDCAQRAVGDEHPHRLNPGRIAHVDGAAGRMDGGRAVQQRGRHGPGPRLVQLDASHQQGRVWLPQGDGPHWV